MFLSKRFRVLLKIPIDFVILFLMYNMWSDQISSIYDHLLLLNVLCFFCISYWVAINDDRFVIIFDSCTMKYHIFFLSINCQFIGF